MNPIKVLRNQIKYIDEQLRDLKLHESNIVKSLQLNHAQQSELMQNKIKFLAQLESEQKKARIDGP